MLARDNPLVDGIQVGALVLKESRTCIGRFVQRNTRGARGRRLQRLRSERVERVFGYLLDTGGGRRTWLRGLDKVRKRYLMATASNLGRVALTVRASRQRHLRCLSRGFGFSNFS